ncbi:26017_t:CDS:2, partial [Gigaspora margarita]
IGLIHGQFYEICEAAATSCEDLLLELRSYKRKEKLYTQPFKKEKESSLKWWLTIDAQKEPLSELAIKIFSISPSQAVYSVNGSTINTSQLEYTKQQFDDGFADSFNPISEFSAIQLDEINGDNLLIEEIINLSNPAFIGNNDSFIEEQGKTSMHVSM